MPNKNQHINIRSEEVQEILTHIPHWMIRSGISLIFMLIILVIFLSWFIKYPDVIKGSVTISTTHPPTKLISKNSGEIESLYFEDGDSVKTGDVLATIGNSFSEQTKAYLDSLCSQIKQQLEQNQCTIKFYDEHLNFGTIYNTYSALKKTILEYQSFLKEDPTSLEIASIKEQIANHTILRSVSYQQLNTAKKELHNAEKKYSIGQKLFAEQVISEVQLYTEEQKLIQAENKVGNFKKSAVQNSIAIADLQRELNQLKLTQKERRTQYTRDIQLGITSIHNAIEQWGINFQITAPVNGKLTYLKTINEHEYITAETPLFAIVSTNQNYIGYIDVPKSGYGKLRIGQNVRVQLDKYPFQQFGQLDGAVTYISILANQDLYRVQFSMPKGMKSSYGKTFEFTPEMSGNADIITDDIRLFTRIFNKFRKTFD